MEMDLLGNASFLNDTVNSVAGSGVNSLANLLSGRGFVQWILRSLSYCLYLANPYQETFQTEEEIPPYDIELFPFFVIVIVLEMLTLWCQGKPLPKLADASTSASMMLNMQILRIICHGVEHSIYYYIYNNYRLVELPWDSPVTWYSAAILVDFFYYWGHRGTHVINALWANHKVHHSGEIYLLVNAFRVTSATDLILSVVFWPVALFVPPVVFIIHHQFNLIYQFWLHSGVIGKLGPIEWIFNTPSHHRVHHGRNKYCLDKNFGAWLIIWDRMFGTFQDELPDETILYGCVDQVKSSNPLYLEVFHYISMYKKWQSVDGWKNKISSIIKGPGWSPGSPWTGHMDQVPEALPRPDEDEVQDSLLWKMYLIAHFFIAAFIYILISITKSMMSYTAIICHLSFSVFTVLNIGMYFDRSRLVPIQEFIRCSFFLIYSQGGIPLLTNAISQVDLTGLFDGQLELYILVALRSYFFVSALLWLAPLYTLLGPQMNHSLSKKVD